MNQKEKILEELLSDSRFRQWVATGEHEEHWIKWKDEHPGNEELVEDAMAIVRGLPVNKVKVSSSEIEKSFQKIKTHAKQNPGNMEKSVWYTHRWLHYAATVIGLLVALWIWNYTGNNDGQIEMAVSTAAGEQKDIILPDSSLVVLNGNSSLQYIIDQNSGARQVLLNGEAHFEVRTRGAGSDRKPFVVTTPDINVAVLGTVFSVSSDSVWTTIVLEEGKIRLSGRTKDDRQGEVLLMKPGEKVIFNRVERKYTVEKIDAVDYNSWTHNQLSLVNRSAEDVARWMNRNYNIQIRIPDQYKSSSLTGSVNLEDPATAIQVVALALGLEAIKTGQNQWSFIPETTSTGKQSKTKE